MMKLSASTLDSVKGFSYVSALFILSAIGVIADDALDFQKNLPVHVVWAVSGQDAELPCNVTPPNDGDKVNMVLWFKDNIGMPLYSLDARGSNLSKANHWTLTNDLGGRTAFRIGGSKMARLHVRNVTLKDEGVFRCRIDFSNSPTVNYRINLTIIVQPSMPIIYDVSGREVTGMAGPFKEGYDMFLECNVTGGRPRPKVSWWQGGLLRDDDIEQVTETSTVNRLFVPTVHRSLWNTYLECRARSSPLADPVIRRVPLDIYLKPQKVHLRTEDTLLSAGNPHLYECQSVGSVPPARITWLIDGQPLRGQNITTIKYLNITTSTLLFKPRPTDDGRELACRAENPEFDGGMLERRKKVHVAYAPVVSVQLKTKATHTPLREGDEVRMVCEIRAMPEPESVTWYHRDGLLDYNESSGVLPDDRTLRLVAVTKDMAGDYSCAAANREGETRSSPIRIRIQYAPRCRTGFETRRAGAMRHQTVTVTCEVDADPGGDDIKFHWTFERGREVIRVPSSWVKRKGMASELVYEPKSEADFGTLACYATNSIGKQEKPCLIHVVAARTPQPPEHCILRNQSSGRMEVVCEAGSDGDLPQYFLLEVSEAPVTVPTPPRAVSTLSDQGLPMLPLGPPVHHVLGAEPRFSLDRLEPGRDYQLAVYAVNAKGRSEPPVIIPSVRISSAMEKLTGTDEELEPEESSPQPMAIVLGVLIAVAVLILGGIFTTAALVTCRRRAEPANIQRQETNPNASQTPRRSMYGEEDDIELELTSGFGEIPRIHFTTDCGVSRSSGIEDEGGGNGNRLHTLAGPSLIHSSADGIRASGPTVSLSPC